ncbi:MAG: RNA helicase, partial [Actinomycetia bacterium]|nr:RNA helicase [Actinomycetes bacterium]
HDFLEGLARGISSHHAGLLPTFKECVEELFSRGLVKAVFATETLALGINMPARSVVLERLSKWNGETHADITPGEYTQLTGRAGRRGIDVEGHGVVLWQPGLDPRQVAGLASKRTYPLKSSFHPSYNMAVNLVRQVGRTTSREMLEQSFAQFQADRAVVGLARKVRKAEEALEGYAEAAQGDAGDFIEYARLRRRIGEREQKGAKRRKAAARERAVDSLNALRPGDVIDVPGGRWAGIAVVVDPGTYSEPSGPRPLVLTLDRHSRRLAAGDFPTPVEPLLRMRIPKSYNPRNPGSRRDLASALRAKTRDMDASHPSRRKEPAPSDPELEELREELRAHPCHEASDREDRVRWADRYLKLEKDTAQQRRQIETRTNTIARQFDRVCDVLGGLGYLDGDTVTRDGERLTQLYSEMDLVASECVRHGVWDELSPEELCAALSGLTYQARNPDDLATVRYPTAGVRTVASRMAGIAADLERVERDHRLSFLRRPDFGFAHAAWQWASGRPLDEVLMESDFEAGDFVRAVKLVLDVADQVANAAGASDLRETARDAAHLLRRGVVAYTSVTQ